MTKSERYRRVFGSAEGHEVLADLAAYAKRLGPAEPASKIIAHITELMHRPEAVVKPVPVRPAGGRIAHG